MQVSKWGNSLAVRLPKDVVDALKLKEGDHVKLVASGKGEMTVEPDRTREEALKNLEALRWELPKGYKFDREDAHERG